MPYRGIEGLWVVAILSSVIVILGRKRSFVRESAGNKKNVYERAARIVKSFGGDYENLNGHFGNGAVPWLYGLAGIQQRR